MLNLFIKKSLKRVKRKRPNKYQTAGAIVVHRLKFFLTKCNTLE